jgi:hypothetical protein
MAKVTISFTIYDHGDRDLLNWLSRLPKRRKSGAIREALREHLRSGVTLGDVYQAVLNLNHKLDAGVIVTKTDNTREPLDDEPPDVAAALDNLGL